MSQSPGDENKRNQKRGNRLREHQTSRQALSSITRVLLSSGGKQFHCHYIVIHNLPRWEGKRNMDRRAILNQDNLCLK